MRMLRAAGDDGLPWCGCSQCDKGGHLKRRGRRILRSRERSQFRKEVRLASQEDRSE